MSPCLRGVPSAFRQRARRGTAEIELIASIVVLMSIMFLSLGAMKIAVARLQTADAAQFQAFQDATTAQVPQYDNNGDLPPIDGTATERPGLPNRTHVATPEQELTLKAGNNENLKPVTVGGKTGLIGPGWTYSAYPVGGADLNATRQWFEDYVSESHGDLTDPLRLVPAWTP